MSTALGVGSILLNVFLLGIAGILWMAAKSMQRSIDALEESEDAKVQAICMAQALKVKLAEVRAENSVIKREFADWRGEMQ